MSPRATADEDDVRALSSALALFAFLIFLKAGLAAWWVFAKDRNPLADAPFDAPLLVIGADLMFCAGLAVLYLAIRKGARLGGRLGRAIGLGAPLLIHTAVVIFATCSFIVTRLYGSPLDVRHLRVADDLSIIGASLMAYVGTLPVSLMLLGIGMYALGHVVAGPIRRCVAGRPRWQPWGAALGVCLVMFGLWGTRLAGIYTFGVKDNAVIYFVRHYSPMLQPIDARRQVTALARELGDRIDERTASQSLHLGNAALPRDLPVAGIADAAGLNVLVIQLESTATQYLDQTTTPNLMNLARQGVRFINHSTVYTESTMATYSLYWSDYIGDLGTSPRLLYERPVAQMNLPEVLGSHGYETGFFHSAFLSWDDFEFFFERKGFGTVADAGTLRRPGVELPWTWGVTEETTVEALTAWIAQQRAGKFFAIYSTMFPHHPYEWPLPEDQRPFPHSSWSDRYRNSLFYADLNIGRVIAFLREQQLLDRTLVIVVGDHGETVSTYPVGHGVAVTSEEIQTPLIVANPRLFPAAQQSSIYSSHLDVAPTILGILGIPPPDAWLGRKLFDVSVPAMASHVTIHLSRSTGIVDNGLFAAFGDADPHGRLYRISAGALEPIADGNDQEPLLARYRERDQLMQTWIRYRHLLRATQIDGFVTAPAIAAD